MPRHHYIPISVLRTFASADAWKVVCAPNDAKRRIAMSDKNRLDHGQTRNWPVVVYRKSTKEITRSTVGHVCSAAELYRLPDYSDQLIRGIVRLNLREDLSLIPDFNFEALMRLGIEPLDPEVIERTAIGNLDRDFGRILTVLRNREEVDEQGTATVRRFIAFATVRTPLFRRRYFAERHGNLVRSVSQQIQLLSEITRAESFEWVSNSLNRLNAEIDQHVYHILLMRYAQGFDPLSEIVKPKMRVLHTSGPLFFVTCDNPSRPYLPNRLRKMFDSRLPGFADPRVQMLFPISPSACVVLSSNRSWRDFAHIGAPKSKVMEINTALAIMSDQEIVFPSPNVRVFQKWLKLNDLRPLLRP